MSKKQEPPPTHTSRQIRNKSKKNLHNTQLYAKTAHKITKKYTFYTAICKIIYKYTKPCISIL